MVKRVLDNPNGLSIKQICISYGKYGKRYGLKPLEATKKASNEPKKANIELIRVLNY